MERNTVKPVRFFIFKTIIALFVLLSLPHMAYAQEAPAEGETVPEHTLESGPAETISENETEIVLESKEDKAEETVFYIRDINFAITGRTRPFALMYHGKFKKGERIIGEKNLEQYLRDKTQLLYNQRVLDTAVIEHTRGEAEAGGEVPVDLLVTTTDSWNIIALPRPLLDDNEGFDLTIKARDYNFLGTMSALRIDLGYNLKPEYVNNGFQGSKGSWNVEIDSDIPFMAFGYNWRFNFDHFFSYVYNENIYYKNVTGVSMELPVALPFSPTIVTFGFNEIYTLNEENAERYKPIYGDYYKDWYMASEAYGRWEIPTGITVHKFGELKYTPQISGKVTYHVDTLQRSPGINFGHSLGFGQIDWKGNFRKGLDASIDNFYQYNFVHDSTWNNSLSLSVTGHLPVASFLGLSGRLKYRHWFNDYNDTAGDAIRGIINRDMAADFMLSLNTDFTFKVLDFRPSIWFKQPKLRLFDLEFHLSPIIDVALVQDPLRNTRFSFEDIQAGGGLELIIFSHFMRSLYLRISFAYNLREFFKTGDLGGGPHREIFVGLYHHY